MVKTNNAKEFDLNIEKILENWEVYHAIREIIANALDEQILTNTKDISIYKSNDGWWHIIDFGRGLNYHHLTQNENEEKLTNDKLIGRFGVGLKDALATLYRHGIKVQIISKYGIITLKEASKSGFDDIITLHAQIAPPQNPNMVGTDFCLLGCNVDDIEKAKSLFLTFSGKNILEKNAYGEVIENSTNTADIYINGVKVAEESNFLFSYNITSLTAQLKKALNRERTNVGRSAYTGRIKDILKACSSEKVIDALVEDLQQFGSGNRHDELSWNDIAMHASIKMNQLHKDTTFVTTSDLQNKPSLIDEMQRSGYNPVVVPDNIISKMEDYNTGAKSGETLTTANQYIKDEKERFVPVEIDINALTVYEKEVYNITDSILKLIGGKPKNVKKIVIVEKIYESELFNETLGLWIAGENKILIKRKQLKSLEQYAGTLLHECAHAISGADDVSRDFELKLTEIIGIVSSKLIQYHQM
ncbi:ATP-binding protein [Ruminococcus bromii]|nr:ATP-binding protein [Ruminococcus bromii]RGI81909.1 ATP-binding protein [Ruminococcus bromii]